jgi:ATP-binding cassette subfamily B (MDR/TAP) protein 1
MASVTGWMLKLNQTKSARDNAAYAEAGAIVYQVAANIRTILALNAGQEMIEKFEAATKKAYDGAVSQLVMLGIANGALMSSFMLAYIVVIGYGAFLLYDSVKSSGCDPSGAITGAVKCNPAGEDIFLALMGVVFGGATMPQISAALEAIQGSRAACFPALLAMSRVSATGDESLDQEATERSEALQRRSSMSALPKYAIDVSSPFGDKPKEVVGKIEFKDVSFAYPTRSEAQVFDGFNLTVEAGTTVALVGPSGSGKSTTVSLIERFYDPTSGSVTLDGVDLRKLNVAWLRSHIGLVSQEPALFATTIKENIRIAKPDATDKEIEEAARAANAHDFISSLEKGYDTHVGDKGAQLSGGQKQRIAIARTLITKPKVILLDEATRYVDHIQAVEASIVGCQFYKRIADQ